MDFTCERCDYRTNLKGNLIKHLLCKRPCIVTSKNIDRNVLLQSLVTKKDESVCLHCPWCQKLISRTNMAKHKKVCKKKPTTSDDTPFNIQQSLPDIEENTNSIHPNENVNPSLRTFIRMEVARHVKTLLSQHIHEDINFSLQELFSSRTHDNNNILTLRDKDSDSEKDNENNLPTPSAAMKRQQKIKPSKRRLVWKTYIGMAHGEAPCLCCKSNTIDMWNFHCGHVKSEADGGTIELSNLRPICSLCNSSMGTTNMIKFAKEQFDVDIV